MATEQREGVRHGECRKCSAFCDKLVEPRGCIELRCQYLYSYECKFTGNTYMGCVRQVYRAEVDVEMFELAENSGGFGGLRMTGEPLPQCQFSVEPAYSATAPRSRASTAASSTARTRHLKASEPSISARPSKGDYAAVR